MACLLEWLIQFWPFPTPPTTPESILHHRRSLTINKDKKDKTANSINMTDILTEQLVASPGILCSEVDAEGLATMPKTEIWRFKNLNGAA